MRMRTINVRCVCATSRPHVDLLYRFPHRHVSNAVRSTHENEFYRGSIK